MCLDVVCLLVLLVTLWYCARKLVGVREYDFLLRAGLDQAMMYRLRHWSRPGVLAFHDVLSRRLLECPDYRLWRGVLQLIAHWCYAVAVYGYDDEVVLLLRLLGYGQAEDLVDVLPCDGEFDGAVCADCPYAAALLVEELKGELLPLWYGEANSGVCPP